MTAGVIQCFLLEPTEEAEESLRRYAGVPEGMPLCPLRHGYHNASVAIGRVQRTVDDRRSYRDGDEHDRSDPRWPSACGCGYVFTPDDHWQHNFDRLYRRSDTGELVQLNDAPAGAMWFAPWYLPTYKGPDGNCLVVRTPAGDWIPDSPSSNSNTPWTRTGTPPLVTCSPSILFPPGTGIGRTGYHGWLRAGRLEEC